MDNELKRRDFYYDLPERLIAQTPLKERDHSRLMVIDRKKTGVKHRHFYDICEYLNKGDCLVINDTRVLPARLYASRKGGSAPVEILLLKDLGADVWECIVRPGKKLREGAEIDCGGLLHGLITEVLPDGNRKIKFIYKGIFLELLDKLGSMPLPHYIKSELSDKERYQTVYAVNNGSAAAPTAGLHFTNELLDKISGMGVDIAKITLHVGLGTFRPVKEENIKDHLMHSEYYEVSSEAADRINAARKNGGRIVCVGTTSVRTLETVADEKGVVHPGMGETSIFITPGVTLKATDALLTNFHLPESTLLMLVSAILGREQALSVYREAVEKEYRFFSFGDCMLILRDGSGPFRVSPET